MAPNRSVDDVQRRLHKKQHHPEDYLTGKLGAVECNRRVRGKMLHEELVLAVECDDVSVIVERVYNLDYTEHFTHVRYERER